MHAHYSALASAAALNRIFYEEELMQHLCYSLCVCVCANLCMGPCVFLLCVFFFFYSVSGGPLSAVASCLSQRLV